MCFLNVFSKCVLLHVGVWTPVLEYDHADDFSSVFITKRRQSYRDIHVPLDLAEIFFSVCRL